MSAKSESTCFSAVQKGQGLRLQDRPFAWGDADSNTFYFASYKDPSTFLQAYSKIPDEEQCFNEQIRGARACSENYDIDWCLGAHEADAVQLEQCVFEEFLVVRNQYALAYPVTKDQSQALSSSSSSKLSLHIVIPTYVFDDNSKHMLAFMQGFKGARSVQDQSENSLGDHIDMAAPWRQSSVHASEAEFFIMNFAECTSSLPKTVVEAVRDTFKQYKHASQYNVLYDRHGTFFKLQRAQAGQCDVCDRAHDHDHDHAYLKLGATGLMYLYCYRAEDASGVRIGRVNFDIAIETMTAISKRSPLSTLVADTAYCAQFVKHTRSHLLNCGGDVAKSLTIRSAIGIGKTEFVYQLPRQRDQDCIQNEVVVQTESLHILTLSFYQENVILILDEFNSFCEQMTSTTAMGNMHDMNNQFLREFIKGISRVICLDADLSNEAVQLLKSLRSDVIDLLHDGKRVWISSTLSADNTEKLHLQLQKEGFHGMRVTANTLASDKRNIIKNINTLIDNHDYFIHASTISVDIDYNVEGHFDYAVGFFSAHSRVTAGTYRQMMQHVMHVKCKTYLVHAEGTTNDLATFDSTTMGVQGTREIHMQDYWGRAAEQ
ncbi:hypothetical protein BGZ51_004678 [Haplosporangium sp. Z 767]|nr:hypothetical protein BGZ51_004678 [Haplosporangium sp. Z 767]